MSETAKTSQPTSASSLESARSPDSAPAKQRSQGLFGWIQENATRITNAGLMTFTSIMLYSGYRGKVISKDIYDKQKETITGGAITNVKGEHIGHGLGSSHSEARAAEVLESGLKSKIIKNPGWHKMRLFYLLTATTSFAFGAFFKRKEETPEELNTYAKMPLHEYMAMRAGQALDPVNHSRQTVGILSGASGVMAVISALSQPGGVHKSELFVGTTLATGGALLGFVNDPKLAQNLFSTLWMIRTPAIITGTRESLFLTPKFKNPFLTELKTQQPFLDAREAAKAGYDEKVKGLFGFGEILGINGEKGLFGIGKDKIVHRTGEKAAKAFEKAFEASHVMELPYKRMDIAYPIGQWGNLASAGIGYLGKAPDKKDKPAAEPNQAPAAQISKPVQVERLQSQALATELAS